MKRNKKGISLIVLVITIIVMIILAAAVIISLSNIGILDKANDAVNLTNMKEIEHIASLAWGEAYADGARTKSELQAAVDKALENVNTTGYDVVVTEKGISVTVKSDEEKGFLIVWNTQDALENATVIIDGAYKISDMIPTKEEIADTTMIVMGMRLPLTSIQETDGMMLAMYADSFPVIFADTAGEKVEVGINIPETGIYVPPILAEEDADIILGTNLNISLSGKTLNITRLKNASKYEVYVGNELFCTTTKSSVDLSSRLDNTTNCYIKVRAIANETGLSSDYSYVWFSLTQSEPGLYDANDILIATWSELVNDYGMDISFPYNADEYQWDSYSKMQGSPYCVFQNNPELSQGTKLIIGYGTAIGSNAFAYCKTLNSISIPDSIISIGHGAFTGCSALEEIIIPDNSKLERVESFAFSGCENLKYAEYNNAYYLGSSNNSHLILVGVTNTSIETCEINENTKVIAGVSFQSLRKFKNHNYSGGSKIFR